MDQEPKGRCTYRSPQGKPCPGESSGKGLCFWHDPEAAKDGVDVRPLLEAWAAEGKPMTGFILRHADLSGIRLHRSGSSEGYDLSHADLYKADLTGAHLFRINLSRAELLKTDLRWANLNQADLREANLLAVALDHAKLENVRWGSMVRQETQALEAGRQGRDVECNDLLEQAEEIYRNLRRVMDDLGMFENAGRFYHREMIMRRKQLPLFSLRRLVSKGLDMLCGYGEYPSRVITTSLFYILACSFLYFSLGVYDGGVEIGFDPELGLWANLKHLGTCFYFSMVTFATLGQGDLWANDIARPVAAFEAFTGSFTLALFVVVFVKKMTR